MLPRRRTHLLVRMPVPDNTCCIAAGDYTLA